MDGKTSDIVMISNDRSIEIKITREEITCSKTLTTALLNDENNSDTREAEIQIPLLPEEIKLYISSLRNYEIVETLDLKNLILLLKVATWFDDEELIETVCDTIIRMKYNRLSYAEILSDFSHQTRTTHLGKELSAEETIYENILKIKFPSPYECVLFKGGYFIATKAHFNSMETLGRIATYMPNVISKIAKSEVTIRSSYVIDTKIFSITYRKITISPYEYIYGHISNSSLDNKDSIDTFTSLISSPGRLDNPFMIISNVNDTNQSDEMDEKFKKLPANNPQIICIRRKLYTIPSLKKLQSNKQIKKLMNTNLSSKQLLFLKKLISDSNFILDHIPYCYEQEYDQEYRCLPVYVSPTFSRQIPQGNGTGFDILSFKSYVIMNISSDEEEMNDEYVKLVLINTQSPYKSYPMELNIDSSTYDSCEIQKVDENRFLFITGYNDIAALFDLRNLREGSAFKPEYIFADDKGSLNHVLIADPNKKNMGIIVWEDDIYSIDDGKLMMKLDNILIEDEYGFDYYDNYVAKIKKYEEKTVINIFSLTLLKIIYSDELKAPTEVEIVPCKDNPDIIGIRKKEKNESVIVIQDGKIIKTVANVLLKNISWPKIADGKIYSSDHKMIVDLQITYPHVQDKYDAHQSEYRLEEEKKTTLTTEIFGVFGTQYEIKEIRFGDSHCVALENKMWHYNITPIGKSDAILTIRRDVPPELKCYKYTACDNRLSFLGCEGGRIFENKSTRKLVVEYGYSGFPEVWV